MILMVFSTDCGEGTSIVLSPMILIGKLIDVFQLRFSLKPIANPLAQEKGVAYKYEKIELM